MAISSKLVRLGRSVATVALAACLGIGDCDSRSGYLEIEETLPVLKEHSIEPVGSPKGSEAIATLKRGQRVRHSQFGDGTILTMEGDGPDAKLTVYFDRAGSKKFIAKYAKLIRI